MGFLAEKRKKRKNLGTGDNRRQGEETEGARCKRSNNT